MPDTLQIDTLQLSAFQHDPQFDYDRELMDGSQSLMEWITEVIGEWISETFDVVVSSEFVTYLLVMLGLLVIAFFAWFWWYKRPKMFMKGEKDDDWDYDVEEDTIYGVNFEAGIARALENQDYRQAVRLVYLQTLKYLEDEGRIEWQLSRTPSQYVRQVNTPAFTSLSRHFINVRYGNFIATLDLYEQIKALQDEIMKGGVRA